MPGDEERGGAQGNEKRCFVVVDWCMGHGGMDFWGIPLSSPKPAGRD